MSPPARRRPDIQLSDAQILRRAAALVAVLFVVGGALLVGSAVFGGPDEPTARSAARPSRLPSTAVASSPEATASTSRTARPSPSPSRHRKPKPKPTRAGMATFVRSYLATVTRDPSAGWRLLTPAFRARSGGFTSYQAFWGTIRSAAPQDVVADTGGMTVSYVVAYTRDNGSQATDSTRLHLLFRHGTYLIDGEG